MTWELGCTPHGRLSPVVSGDGPEAGDRRILKAFGLGSGPGLFELAAARSPGILDPVLGYWREFGCLYLAQLCRLPDVKGVKPEPIPVPSEVELAEMLLSLPPMRGAEYIHKDTLRTLWTEMDEWVRQSIHESGGTLSSWLKAHAPLWHQVGRVCFHLAENRKDPDYPFAFMATYAPGISKSGRVQYLPLSKALDEFAGARNKPKLVQLLSPVYEASRVSSLVLDLVESGDIYHPLAWTSSEAYEFLKNAPAFEESGILVRLPDWWRKRVRPRVRVSIGEKTRGVLGSEGLLDFHVNIALGDQKLTKAEWESLRQMDEGLAFIRGQWVEVNREKLEEVLSHWKEMEGEFARNGISFVEGMRLLAGAPTDLRKQEKLSVDREWSSVQPGSWLEETLELLRDPSRSEVILPGKSLNGTLRTYQESGLRWLWLLSKLGLGACLADDMGLGKTIQVIALLLALKRGDKKQGKPSLLILPASLLANWKTEIEKFAPSLKTLFIHSSEMNKPDMEQLARAPEKGMKGVDVVLTTYGMAMRLTWLRNVDWRLVILDEAQAVKNPDARQTKAVKQMKSDARIALTGTPVENRLTDLWSLFDFLCPGLLGSASEFRTYLKEYQLGQQITYTPIRRLVSPYILRRLKTDRSIISDLPDKTEMKAYCCLSKRQAVLYSSLVEELEEALQSSEEGIQRKGMILAYLMRFKQICNHPGQFLKNGEFDPGDSGKFERLRELCEEIGSRQEKVLVFTQFQEMTQPLSEYLAMQFGREGLVLHGGTPVKKRRGLVDAFQREDGPPFFILSLKAGGTGLNLTAASHVIHFDRWWNPAVENQATDRAFRIGQKRNVLVHKFICRGTIEEQIDMIIEDKLQLAEDLLGGGGEALLTELSNAELLKIVSLDLAKATE